MNGELGAPPDAAVARGRVAVDVAIGAFLLWLAVSILAPHVIPRFAFLPKPGPRICEEGVVVPYEHRLVWWVTGC